MQFKKIARLLMVVSASFTAIDSFAGETQPISVAQSAVQLQEIRNATVKITYADTTFLIDPMLSKKGTYPGFKNT